MMKMIFMTHIISPPAFEGVACLPQSLRKATVLTNVLSTTTKVTAAESKIAVSFKATTTKVTCTIKMVMVITTKVTAAIKMAAVNMMTAMTTVTMKPAQHW
ncbi:hypothetical protein AAFF_G00234290 [Aldrovandia affinis]|uniref:Uncharacterized protein n=1 Tax=Aldrovandia affinis TaxID=143900 RepID=A0AAD7SUZ0_9TELE|nr:hypothetical protein AAFF_G00234290 [Aldrovandia affinis]